MRLEHLLSREVPVCHWTSLRAVFLLQPFLAAEKQASEKEELLQRQSIQDDRALHAPPDVRAVCQFLDRHRSKDAKWNKAVRSCRHPHGSYEPTIFDILKSFK